MPKDALYLRLLELYEFGAPVDLNEIAVLYGGIGNKVEIEINGAKKEISVEPVGVIVIGIDGLTQVRQTSPIKQSKMAFFTFSKIVTH